MARIMRYFTNTRINEDSEMFVEIEFEKWKPLILDYLNLICHNFPPTIKNADGGVYVGVPGVAFMFCYLAKSPLFKDYKSLLMTQGKQYLHLCDEYLGAAKASLATDYYGFYLGRAGVNAISLAFLHLEGGSVTRKRLDSFVKYSKYCPIQLSSGVNELFIGRSGYLLGARWLERWLMQTVLSETAIAEICDLIVLDGRRYATERRSPTPLMYAYYDTEYLGAAHGLSTILFTLLQFDAYLAAKPDVERDVKLSVDYLLSLQMKDGNFPSVMNERFSNLVHWCHGAPGIVYLMAKAYLRWKDPKYLQSCLRCGDCVWEKGLLKKGPGICHGIAGNGYVFLLLYRLTGDKRHLSRARIFAEFLQTDEFRNESRTPDKPYSLFEGLAGTVCFLLDMLRPDEAAFPFMDVF